MVFQSGEKCDRCHKTFDYKMTLDKRRKLYQCYVEEKQNIQTTCGNNFQNIFANHNVIWLF